MVSVTVLQSLQLKTSLEALCEVYISNDLTIDLILVALSAIINELVAIYLSAVQQNVVLKFSVLGSYLILELWRYLVVCSYLGLSSFLSGHIYPFH